MCKRSARYDTKPKKTKTKAFTPQVTRNIFVRVTKINKRKFMAAPTKPWERAGINYQNSGSLPANNMSGYA